MPVDRSEWLRHVEADAAREPARPLVHPAFAQHLRVVAAKLEHLPDSDSWAVYRAQVEALIEETETQIAALREQMDEMFGDEHLRARMRVERLLGRRDGYREALQAPGVVLGTEATVRATDSA